MRELRNMLKDQMYLESRRRTGFLSFLMLPNIPSGSNVKMVMTLLSCKCNFVLI